MELSERCIAQLEKEGYKSVYEEQIAAGVVTEYPNTGTGTSLFVTEGSCVLSFQNKHITVSIGERQTIPHNVPYIITSGKQGCQYVIGECTT